MVREGNVKETPSLSEAAAGVRTNVVAKGNALDE